MTDRDKKWNMQFEQLVGFKRTNGHCMVPCRYEQDASLGQWVGTQRSSHINNNLRLDRKDRLDEIGFAWKADGDKLWHQQCEMLVEFKRKSGHCMVPNKYKQDASLGIWVSKQRSNHINNCLRLDRKERLDEIGFAWKADGDKLWHQQYEKLFEFKRKSGHCMVPGAYEQDKSLGQWVNTQRRNHNKNTMRPDRKELLDKIGFAWKYITLAARASTTDNSDSEAFTRPSSVGLPNDTPPEEAEPQQGNARNKYPSSSRKRRSSCLAETGLMAASRTYHQRGNTTVSGSSVATDCGRDEEDANPSLVATSGSALIGSDPDQEFVQDEGIIPSGWTRVKLEPDC